jgi:hypothetical protein
MNFKTGFIALALMGVGAVVAVGCGGNACDELADKFAACSSDTTSGTSSASSSGTAECTDAQITQAQCVLDSGADVCKLFTDPTGDDAMKIAECYK